MARLIPKKCVAKDCPNFHCNKTGFCSTHAHLIDSVTAKASSGQQTQRGNGGSRRSTKRSD